MLTPRCISLCSLLLVLALTVSASGQGKKAIKPKGKVGAAEKTKVPMADSDSNPLRRYSIDPETERIFFGGVPPASCAEWATKSPPPYPETAKCKELGGKSCCDRCNGPSYDVGPTSGLVKVGEPFKVHLRVRHLGVGDYVIYGFGKIDWGDNAQQDVIPVGQDVELTHVYDTATQFTIHVVDGAQFKYQGSGSCSYECCVDNSIPVKVTP